MLSAPTVLDGLRFLGVSKAMNQATDFSEVFSRLAREGRNEETM